MKRAHRELPYFQPMEPYHRQTMRPYPRHSGSGFGYLLVVLLSVFYIAIIANGMRLLSGTPFFVCLMFAGILFAMKMYFLRRQPPHELSVNSGWDKVVGYLASSIASVILAAYGLYGLSVQVGEASAAQPQIRYLRQNGNDQHVHNDRLSREQIELRVRELEEDLVKLSKYQPTPARDKKVADFEVELLKFRKLLEASPRGFERSGVINSLVSQNQNDDDKSHGEGRIVTQQDQATPPDGQRDQPSPAYIENLPQPVTEKPSNASPSDADLKNFAKATLSQSTYAMGCWIITTIVEVLILVLVIYLRPRYSYWE